jgi:hypothetical protein
MRIYGAGLAGLLAAVMLRRHKPMVCEAQESLPHNHNALLRFRSDAVSRAIGIPFKKVLVHKAICYSNVIETEPSLYYSNLYSRKVTGSIISRSIDDLTPVERYIAPPDLIAQLADGLDIRYSTPLAGMEPQELEPVISTIPMPYLMKMAGWKNVPEFTYQPVTSITCDIETPNVDVYQTIYYPGDEEYYRVSITGNHLIIEMMGDYAEPRLLLMEGIIRCVLSDFGIKDADVTNVQHRVQKFGKIVPIDNELVRSSSLP